ncbi:uncharacterized protein LOC127359504 isoform X2 [Dicentrarchus labrax]|nr:uncharacterized protein LOC127359504 isoform X2 [Dicentrarchus labrax]
MKKVVKKPKQRTKVEFWGEPFKQRDPVRVSRLGTDEFTTMDSGTMTSRTGRGIAETFLWPPVYRSPCYPVFFYAGNRRYNREPPTPPALSTVSAPHEEMDPLTLAQILKGLSDRLEDTATDFRLALQVRDDLHLARAYRPPPYITYLFISSKVIITSITRRLIHRLTNFTWNHRSDCDVLEKMEQQSEQTSSEYHSHLLHPPDCLRSRTDSSCLSRSHSVPSLSLTTSADNKTFTRAKSLPDMLFKNSFEEFTPDITADENDESYRFQCSCPGLYQCSVTGLLFHMEGEGDVVYRIVPWDRRLLGQHHKQPAGPLFDIKCVQQSMCQLHLPHCEIRSTGGCGFLSVAHVNDDSIEFIVPHKITETHVIINITGFSAFGNVKDEDCPPDPVRALVLLFYRPPADPDLESLLNVLLLPTNVVLRDVLRIRKKLFGEDSLIQASPHCKLHPKQEYKLSTCPEDDSVLVQPTEAEFDCDNYDNYFPTFQVNLEKIMKHIKLFLRETKSPHSVWERRVCLSPSAVKRCVQGSSDERLLDIWSSFIDGISGPVLKSLLDKLFEKTVLTDSERESADEIQNKRDKARFVIETVKNKAAGSEMIDLLCEIDPFFSEHLGLI